jgi:glutamate-1-semialdehyde 2,1-aminomutase
MQTVAPAGPVYQAGTLAGNPVAVTAGIAMLQHLESNPGIYATLDILTKELTANLPAGIHVNRIGSMHTLFLHEGPVRNYEEAKRSNTEAFGLFFHHLLDRGVYFPPSQFESGFLSSAHTPQDIAYTRSAIREFFA